MSQNNSNEFQSSNLHLIAFLIARYNTSILSTKRNGSRVVFQLQGTCDFNKVSEEFFTGGDEVHANKFLSALDRLRDLIRLTSFDKDNTQRIGSE